MAYRPKAERIPNAHKDNRPRKRAIGTPKGLDKDLYKEFRTLAKRADQRMVRLERYAQRPEYEAVLGFAYKNFQENLKRFATQRELDKLARGEPLRSNVVPRNDREMLARISALRGFLSAASSTITKVRQRNPYTGQWEIKPGVREVYQQRNDTLRRKYGMEIGWQNLGTLFGSEHYKQLESQYGSDETLKVIGEVVVGSLTRENIKKMEEGANIRIISTKIPIGELGSGIANEAARRLEDFKFAVAQFFVDREDRKKNALLIFDDEQIARDAEKMFAGKTGQEIVDMFTDMGFIR